MKYIELTQDQYAIVDDEDFELISQHKWYATRGRHTFYAVRDSRTNKNPKIQRMHRLIMKPNIWEQVDHIDGNGLNNIRSNLRICSKQENHFNSKARHGTSCFKGVGLHKPTQKWRARIRFNTQEIHLGLFNSETEAAKAYDQKAKELFGEFARLNFNE